MAGQQRCQADILYHLSYLADAVALEHGDLLADYVYWIAAFLGRRGIAREHPREMLAVLDETLLVLPAETQMAARGILLAGRDVLAAEE